MDAWLETTLAMCLRGMAGGAVLGIVPYLGLQFYLDGIDALHCVILSAFMVSSPIFTFLAHPSLSFAVLKSVPVPLVLNALAFLSNSFPRLPPSHCRLFSYTTNILRTPLHHSKILVYLVIASIPLCAFFPSACFLECCSFGIFHVHQYCARAVHMRDLGHFFVSRDIAIWERIECGEHDRNLITHRMF